MRALLILPDSHPFLGPGPTLIAIDVDKLDLTRDYNGLSTIKLAGQYFGPVQWNPGEPVDLHNAELGQLRKAVEA